MEQAKRVFDNNPRLQFADTPYSALENADALAIVTEWKAFRTPDFSLIKNKLKQPIIFDGRNMYDPEAVRVEGIEYYSIGRN